LPAAGVQANIPPKSYRKHPQPFDRALYRRNVVERFFNRIKQYGGLATRYDKHAESFMGGMTLAAIRIAIRGNESTAWCRATLRSGVMSPGGRCPPAKRNLRSRRNNTISGAFGFSGGSRGILNL